MRQKPAAGSSNRQKESLSFVAQRGLGILIGCLALSNIAVGLDAIREAPQRRTVENFELIGKSACHNSCQFERDPKIRSLPKSVIPHKIQVNHSPVVSQKPLPSPKPLAAPKNESVHITSSFKARRPHAADKRQFKAFMRQPSTINDISFPQCKLGFPSAAQTGIVGVNNGHPLSANPCFKAEVDLYQDYQLYLNTDYPGKVTAANYQDSPFHCKPVNDICFAYNYGHSSGAYAVNFAVSQGADKPSALWLDVETGNKWRGTPELHRADLQGEVDALRTANSQLQIGFYSTINMWSTITGGWENGMPEWIASGSNAYQAASPYCHDHNFTGGRMVMAQFTTQFDQNVVC